MESLKNNLWLLPLLIALILCGYWWYKGEKEKVKKIIAELILSVGEHYVELSGREKFDKVLHSIYNTIPKYLKVFFTVEQLSNYIQKEYEKLKTYLKGSKGVEEKLKNIALASVNETIKKAISLDYKGNKNLVSNEQLKKINEEADMIYGKVKYNTNFSDKRELIGEMGFKKSI